MKVWRIGFKYENMAKYRLMPAEFPTKEAAESDAKNLIASKPFKTIVVEWEAKGGAHA